MDAAIYHKCYDEVFEEYELFDGIFYVELTGIRVSGQNDRGVLFYQLKNSQKYAEITVNNTILQDVHKEKFGSILEIINE